MAVRGAFKELRTTQRNCPSYKLFPPPPPPPPTSTPLYSDISQTQSSPSNVTANTLTEEDNGHASVTITEAPRTIGGARRIPLSNDSRCIVPSLHPTTQTPPDCAVCLFGMLRVGYLEPVKQVTSPVTTHFQDTLL